MDERGVQCLQRYYCQLLLLGHRFPMLPDAECSVQFTWYSETSQRMEQSSFRCFVFREDAFQREENTFNDIRFEEASILYNIGVVNARLGGSEPRKTHEVTRAKTCVW